MDEKYNVLFICTGNTCRSPMAAEIFKKKIGDRQNVCVLSRGIAASDGQKASDNAIEVMREEGIDISSHRAKLLEPGDLGDADLIVTMSESVKDRLEYIGFGNTVTLGSGITDPFGSDIYVYRKCVKEIESAIDSLLLSDRLFSFSKTPFSVDELLIIENKVFLDPWNAFMFESEMHSGICVSYFCRYLGSAAGYLFSQDASGDVSLSKLAVAPALRRRGAGKKLFSMLLDYCKQTEANKLTLEVRASNEAALSLYNSLGMKTEGVRKNYYSNPTEDAVVMSKDSF